MIHKYLAFEGIDGCGKTSICTKVGDYLKYNFNKVHYVKEPGIIGSRKEIRDVIFNNHFNDTTNSLLMAADRNELISNEVIPKLKDNYWVLSDRSMWSSLAYTDLEPLQNWCLIRLACYHNKEYYIPFTFFIDTPIETCIDRLSKRDKLDKFESVSIEKITARRDKYLDLAKQFPQNIAVIDSSNLSLSDILYKIIPYIT